MRTCSKFLLVACAAVCASAVLPVEPADAQLKKPRFLDRFTRDRDDAPSTEAANEQSPDLDASQPENAAPAADSAATTSAVENCLRAGEVDTARNIDFLFGSGSSLTGLASSDISEYLVGLCVPDDLPSQARLNDYLITRGSVYSFYAERSLEELTAYLEEAGVELGIKLEAIEKDSKIGADFHAAEGLDGAAYLLNQPQHFSQNADVIVPAIAELREEQREEATAIASRARSYAGKAAYFLARGAYVSQQMADAMLELAEQQGRRGFRGLRLPGRGGGNPLDALGAARDGLASAEAVGSGAVQSVAAFVQKNGRALGGTLANTVKVVRSFNTSPTEIPSLSDEQLDDDARRLGEEWNLPAEFEDEEIVWSTDDPSADPSAGAPSPQE